MKAVKDLLREIQSLKWEAEANDKANRKRIEDNYIHTLISIIAVPVILIMVIFAESFGSAVKMLFGLFTVIGVFWSWVFIQASFYEHRRMEDEDKKTTQEEIEEYEKKKK